MTAQACVCGCGRPTPEGYACTACAQRLAEALEIAGGHAEYAWEVIARQRSSQGGSGGGSRREQPLPYDPDAAADYRSAENTLTTWARHICEVRGIDPNEVFGGSNSL